eukprot:2383143-Prymnesium_polylepis.1
MAVHAQGRRAGHALGAGDGDAPQGFVCTASDIEHWQPVDVHVQMCCTPCANEHPPKADTNDETRRSCSVAMLGPRSPRRSRDADGPRTPLPGCGSRRSALSLASLGSRAHRSDH